MADVVRMLPLVLAGRVLLGFVLGAVVGAERGRRARAAGLRAHMLVAGGAAIFTVASLALFADEGGDTGTARDPARIAAGVVAGVGFLGAGAILRAGGAVSGLTTAASIWVAAGLGMLAGGGAYSLAILSTLFTLVALRLPKRRLQRRAGASGGDAEDRDGLADEGGRARRPGP